MSTERHQALAQTPSRATTYVDSNAVLIMIKVHHNIFSDQIKCLSPESQSRWRGSSCGTTGTKRHSHGFFMDDDDSSSENELLQSFAQESYDQFHKTHKQLSTRSSISSKRAVSMDYDECDKVYMR